MTQPKDEQQLRMAIASEIIGRFDTFAKGKEAIDAYYQNWLKQFTDIDLQLFVPSMIHYCSQSFDFVIDPIIRGKVKHIAEMDIDRFKKEMKRRGIDSTQYQTVHMSPTQARRHKTTSVPEAISILNKTATKH